MRPLDKLTYHLVNLGCGDKSGDYGFAKASPYIDNGLFSWMIYLLIMVFFITSIAILNYRRVTQIII